MQANSWTAVVFVCVVSACGAARTEPTEDGGASLIVSGQSDAGLDAGVPILQLGMVQLYQTEIDAGVIAITTSVVTANFFSLADCQVELIDGCKVKRCPHGAVHSPRGAGLISVAGSSIDGGVHFDSNSTQTPFVSYTQKLWTQSGQRLEVKAQGGAVPAFAASIRSPGKVEFSQTPCPATACMLRRTQSLALGWTGQPENTFVSVQLSTTTPARDTLVQCTTPAATGVVTVSSAALAHLDPVDSATLVWQVDGREELDVLGWQIQVTASEVMEMRQLSVE